MDPDAFIPDKFNDRFNETYLKLQLFLNFYFNNIQLTDNEFNLIFLSAKKLLLKEILINPFASRQLTRLYQKINTFIEDNFDIKSIQFEIENILYITLCINLLSVIQDIKKLFKKAVDEDLIKIKLKVGYLIKSLSNPELVFPHKNLKNEISLKKIFNIDLKIDVLSGPVDYNNKVVYLLDNIKKILKNLHQASGINKDERKLDHNTFFSYHDSITGYIDNLLKSDPRSNPLNKFGIKRSGARFNLSGLLMASFLMLKIIDHIYIILNDIYRL